LFVAQPSGHASPDRGLIRAMPARARLYLFMSAVVVAALVASVALVWSYRPRGADIAQISNPSPSISPGTLATGSEEPSPTNPTRTPTAGDAGAPSLAKQTQPESAAPSELRGYIWPVHHALITSRFAPRDAGFVIIDGQEVHDGLDLATFCGDKVRAAHDGTVLYAGRNFDPFFGYLGDPSPIYARLERLHRVNEQPIVVVVDDGNGYRSVYVHLQEALADPGAEVKAGDVIGIEGATGYATGCHLHYGLIRMDGEWQEVVPQLAKYGYPPFVRERVDPLKVLPWGDENAPERLRERVYGTPSPSTSPAPATSPNPSATPSATPMASPAAPTT
jgi:murein DD-endopeptidase MepM/ murein hydrolase activator NlpD